MERHAAPEDGAERLLAGLVAEGAPGQQRPRPASRQGHQVQGRLADAAAIAPRRRLVDAIEEQGRQARRQVERHQQRHGKALWTWRRHEGFTRGRGSLRRRSEWGLCGIVPVSLSAVMTAAIVLYDRTGHYCPVRDRKSVGE